MSGNVYKAGAHAWYEAGNVSMSLDSGSLTVTGDMVAFGSLSDSRLKEGVQDMDPLAALGTLANLRPVRFTWADNIMYAARRGCQDEGLIAQEVAQVYPYVTGDIHHNDGNDNKIVRYEKLTPLLICAVKALAQRVEQLEQHMAH